MWAQARICLRLSSEEFWALTPRQFHLLFDQYRKTLVHREMLHGFTTAAVKNASPWVKDDPAIPLHYMPNHPDFGGTSEAARREAEAAKLTPEQQRAHADLQVKLIKLKAEMEAGKGEMLDRIRRGEKTL